MTNWLIDFRSRVFPSLSPRRAAEHDFFDTYLGTRRRLASLLQPRQVADCRVLDLGCGYSYPVTLLLHADGVAVTGVDVTPVFYRDGRLSACRARLQERRALAAVKILGPLYEYYRRYHAELAQLAGKHPDHSTLHLARYDGRHLPFRDESFDIVLSNAVLEHVADVPQFAAEAARVLAPGGVVDMLWHNFYCPSGGHTSEEEMRRVPWGHLTGESASLPGLNRLLPEQVRTAFARVLTVERVIGADARSRLAGEPSYRAEGDACLASLPRTMLAEYGEDLVTTRAFVLQARKGTPETSPMPQREV